MPLVTEAAQALANDYLAIARKRNRFGSTETTFKASAAMSMISDAQEELGFGHKGRASTIMNAAKILMADIIDIQEAIEPAIPEIDCALCGNPFTTVGLVCARCSA